jgi:hypothetical protein
LAVWPLHLTTSRRDGLMQWRIRLFKSRKPSGHVSYHWAFRYHHRRNSTDEKLGEPGDQSTGPDFPAAEFFLWDHLRAKLFETRPAGFPKL